MSKRRWRPWMLVLVTVVLLGWPWFQYVSSPKSTMSSQELLKLLHQVSVFQAEILVNQLMNPSVELEGLKQAAYSVLYTHQRLEQAVGSQSFPPLSSVDELLQYILFLQIASREQMQEEHPLLQQAGEPFAKLVHAYRDLLSSNGKVIRSKHDEVVSYDTKIQRLFREKLLE